MDIVEQYLEKSKTISDEQYKIEEFPFIVSFEGYYGPCGILDEMENWCIKCFGLPHGECRYEERGRGPCPYADIDEDGWKEFCKEFNNDVYDEEMWTYDHSHKGKWTYKFIRKTGYDYGIQDFYFKHEEDAIYFKLYWMDEVEKSKK